MEEPEYLLTYNASNYEWFHSKEEMLDFIEENELSSYEALYIPEAFIVDFEDE
ncbi:hypothetical protein [Radiobacillus deserti]|uniref:hypothetical protein n=1 Tax=Radiobacillus deserti TaxID=2594883 RepID=UPI001315184E|nr:hypothetical protein [Radiobacillus deserti]